jgi:hypothetical protein
MYFEHVYHLFMFLHLLLLFLVLKISSLLAPPTQMLHALLLTLFLFHVAVFVLPHLHTIFPLLRYCAICWQNSLSYEWKNLAWFKNQFN